MEKTTKNDSLTSDQCLITGKALDIETEEVIVGGALSLINGGKYAEFDQDGQFYFLFERGYSDLFFYHPQYGEIILPASIVKYEHTVEISLKMQPQIKAIELEKPVIYLYAKTPTKVAVTIEPKGELTFTYPDYNKGWNVTVGKNGSIISGDQTYPYLFWEAHQNRLNFKGNANGMEGFYLKTDSVVSFLETQLTLIGLNTTESTDFITYWAPRIQQYEYAALQFWVDNEYDKEVARITVTPKPEAMRRVFMVFKGVDQDMKVDYFTPQKWKPFDRKGLTLIEWGGAEL